MPDAIQFLNGNQIINRYAADGRKLETEYFTMKLPLITPIYKDTIYKWSCSSGLVDQTGIIYIDNLEYLISSGMLQSLFLLRMHNTEGYVDNVTINPYGPYYYYYYYHTDHLGNIREVWRAAYSVSGTVTPASVIQQTQYYPSGLPWLEGTGASTQPYKYNGKEFIEMHGYDTYDIVWRQYYPAILRFQTPDPLAELKYSISPYAFCGNNPINRIDPDGRWFDDKNEKKAQKLEKKIDKKSAKLEKQIAKLEKKGKDVGDRKERVGELKQSKTDIADMRGNKVTEFKYASANDKSNPSGVGKPTTTSTGENQVTMFTENTDGSNIHEGRHGGDISRGTLTNSTYGVQDEISAYKAQYSFDGKFNYVPYTDFSNQANIMKLTGGIQSFQITLTNINQFTPDLINSMVDKAGLMQVPVYPPTGVSKEQWNNN